MINQIIAESNYFIAAAVHFFVAGATYWFMATHREELTGRVYAQLVLHGYALSTVGFGIHQSYWWFWKHFSLDWLLSHSWLLWPTYAMMVGGLVLAFVGLTRAHASSRSLLILGAGFCTVWGFGIWLAWPQALT